MDALMHLQSGGFDDDDVTTSYMQQAWTRLCKCLGQDFIPYLQVVMPHLLKSARLKPDVQVTDLEDGDAGDDEDDEVEHIEVGDKRISIRTSVLEEKATACNMLCCYVDELKEGFVPYIQDVVETMVPLLDFYFHEDVRKAAVASLPDILRAGKAGMEKGVVAPSGVAVDAAYFRQLVTYVVPPLVKALNKEPEVEIQAAMLESLADCAGVAGECISEHIAAMIAEFQNTLKQSLRDADRRQQTRRGRGFRRRGTRGAQGGTSRRGRGVRPVRRVCVGSLLRIAPRAGPPGPRTPPPGVRRPMLAPDRSPEERRIAICVFDDVMEHARTAARASDTSKVSSARALAGCRDADADVRQASVYGVGVMAQALGAPSRRTCPRVLAALAAVIQAPDARDEENANATENAVSSLGKLCEFQRGAIPGPENVVPQWLSCLPLREDKVEARRCTQLARMLEKGDPHLLGPNREHLGRVVKVFAVAMPTATLSEKLQLCTKETAAKMKAILMQMQGSVPPEQLQAAWGGALPGGNRRSSSAPCSDGDRGG